MIDWKPIATAPKHTTQGDFLISRWTARGDCAWVQIVRNPRGSHMGIKIASHWASLEPPPENLEADLQAVDTAETT